MHVSDNNDNKKDNDKDNNKDKGDRPVLEKQGNSRSVSTPGKVLQQSAPTNRRLAHLGLYSDGCFEKMACLPRHRSIVQKPQKAMVLAGTVDIISLFI